MNEQVRKKLNDPILLSHYERMFQSLQDYYDTPRPEPIWLPMRYEGKSTKDIYTDPEGFVDEAMYWLADHVQELMSRDDFGHLAIENWLYGVHFTDKVLGADVYYKEETDMWNVRYLTREIGTLEKPNLETNETWKIAQRMVQAYLKWDVQGVMIVPPVIASPLNVAVNLYGAEILIAMLEEPEKAKHDLRVITDTQIEMHRWYRDNIPASQLQMICGCRTQPPGYGQLCGCSTQLVSSDLYEEFIMELDEELLNVYPHGGHIHLCGSHGHLIPLFAKMKSVKSFQMNDRASEDLELYAKGLREDQIIYLLPCKGMPVERAMEIAKTMVPKMILIK